MKDLNDGGATEYNGLKMPDDPHAMPPWALQLFLGARRARAESIRKAVGLLVVGPLACVFMGLLLRFQLHSVFLMAVVAGLPISALAILGEKLVNKARYDSILVTAFLQALFYAALVTFGLWLALGALEFAQGPAELRLLPVAVAALGTHPLLYVAYLVVFASGLAVRAVGEVSHKIGPKMMRKWLMGYYRKPREESRLFMFLDLMGSTELAEKLGHLKYSALVRDCFSDLTSPLFESDGEVMHYVGDEAVVSWHTADGLRDATCLRCFFHFLSVLESHRDHYETRYGVMPRFKAGMHLGPVVVTEVGKIKSEIVFHGDVLNTTARIRSQCRELNSRLLVSKGIVEGLPPMDWYQATSVGDVELKGKAERLELYRIELREPESASGRDAAESAEVPATPA